MSPEILAADKPVIAAGSENVRAATHELEARHLSAFYGTAQAVENINLKFRPNIITALIGPSGCGKSTVLRCLNRMHEVIKGAYATGEVLLNGTAPSDWLVKPGHIAYVHGWGMREDLLRVGLRALIDRYGEAALALDDLPGIRAQLIELAG